MTTARHPLVISRGVRYSTRGRRRRETSRRMKLVAALYVLQLIVVAGSVRSDQRIRDQVGTISAETRLHSQLETMANKAGEVPVILAEWAGFCIAAVIGILFCAAEFRRGGNRTLGTRGIIAGLAVAALSIFWPLLG
jgi:hypothetical protein